MRTLHFTYENDEGQTISGRVNVTDAWLMTFVQSIEEAGEVVWG